MAASRSRSAEPQQQRRPLPVDLSKAGARKPTVADVSERLDNLTTTITGQFEEFRGIMRGFVAAPPPLATGFAGAQQALPQHAGGALQVFRTYKTVSFR